MITNFTKMVKKYDLKKYLINNICKKGFKKPTAVQMQAMPILLEVIYYNRKEI